MLLDTEVPEDDERTLLPFLFPPPFAPAALFDPFASAVLPVAKVPPADNIGVSADMGTSIVISPLYVLSPFDTVEEDDDVEVTPP